MPTRIASRSFPVLLLACLLVLLAKAATLTGRASVPNSREFVDYLMDRLGSLGDVRARRMFGGHGVYLDGLMFGLVADAKYGGNRDGVGWALIGFEREFAYQPPFGFYDRDEHGGAADGEVGP